MKKKIKVRIPRPKQKFYRQCEFDEETWQAIRYFYLGKGKPSEQDRR